MSLLRCTAGGIEADQETATRAKPPAPPPIIQSLEALVASAGDGKAIKVKVNAMSVAAQPIQADTAEVRRLRTLYRLLAELSQAKALEDVYDAALTSLLEATFADRAAILLFDDAGLRR